MKFIFFMRLQLMSLPRLCSVTQENYMVWSRDNSILPFIGLISWPSSMDACGIDANYASPTPKFCLQQYYVERDSVNS
jgi:hypothetical protein